MSNKKADTKKQGSERASKMSGLVQMASAVMGPRLLLIFSTIALLVFGLIMVYSSSFVEAFADPEIADSMHFFKRQAMMVGIGVVLLIVAAAINYRIWNTPVSWVVWFVVVVLLVATLIFGETINGGKRWLDIFGQSLQASEFAKIALVLLVGMLAIKLRETTSITSSIVALAVVVGIPIILIMMQPDLGTTLIIFAGIIAIAWFAELSLKPLAIAGLLVMVIAASGIMLAGFRLDRIDAWLDPFSYASTTGYQIVNSFYAFAGGGIDGVGLGMSHQKYLYLPEPYNDLIFPIIGEEFGLIGTVAVVVLFLVYLFAAFRIAKNAPDFYGRIIAGSAATLIGAQAFLNMLCMVNILPMTGKPLPFFSYGGSSTISTLILTGLILNVSFRTKQEDAAGKRREQLKIFEGGTRGLVDNTTGLAYTLASANSGTRTAFVGAPPSGAAVRNTSQRGKRSKSRNAEIIAIDEEIFAMEREVFATRSAVMSGEYGARRTRGMSANPLLKLSPARNAAAAQAGFGSVAGGGSRGNIYDLNKARERRR